MKELKITEKFGTTMIIVPHQDDEILMTAGVIRKLIEQGIELSLVMVTNGDCECEDYSKGKARLEETLEGVKMLGMEARQVEFLGYADTGMEQEDSFLTHLYEEKDGEKVYRSFCTDRTYGLENKQEYHLRKWGEHASYTRNMLKEDIKTLIRESHPNNIFTTSEQDLHGDHAALCSFVHEILDELEREEQYTPVVYCGLVHSCAGDENWPERDNETFNCPDGFGEQNGCCWEERLVLKVPEIMKRKNGTDNLKYQALLKYETALEPGAYSFLMAFIKDEEIFWRIR